MILLRSVTAADTKSWPGSLLLLNDASDGFCSLLRPRDTCRHGGYNFCTRGVCYPSVGFSCMYTPVPFPRWPGKSTQPLPQPYSLAQEWPRHTSVVQLSPYHLPKSCAGVRRRQTFSLWRIIQDHRGAWLTLVVPGRMGHDTLTVLPRATTVPH